MAIDFPNSPTTGDTYTVNGRTWKWDGTTWAAYGNYPDPTVFKVDTTSGYVGINNISPTVALDVTGSAVFSGSITVDGDFTVSGTTTTINTTQLNVEDNIITLNYGVTGAPSLDAGIEVERGDETNAQLLWDESAGAWVVNSDFTVDTDTLHVDSTNNRVGIGTAAPSVELHVAGDVVIDSSEAHSEALRLTAYAGGSDLSTLIGGSDSGGLIETLRNSHLALGIRENDGTDSVSIVSGGGNYLNDSTYDTIVAKFQADGNVGIGTATPAVTLDVDGIAQAERAVLDRNGVADGFPAIDVLYPGAASGYNYLLRAYNDTNPTAVMFVNGTTRTADGGASMMTIRNDNGPSRFGNASYATTIEGTSVTMPGKPAFKAYSTSGDYAAGAVLPYPNVVYNIGNHYNSSLSRFVAPVAGVYHFHAQVYRRNASADDEVAMRVNAVDVTRSRTKTVGATGYANNHMTELLYLNPGDYVDVDVALNGAHLNSGLFSFQGHLVG